ncbi:hypothetical protein [Desulfoplanes sp.]
MALGGIDLSLPMHLWYEQGLMSILADPETVAAARFPKDQGSRPPAPKTATAPHPPPKNRSTEPSAPSRPSSMSGPSHPQKEETPSRGVPDHHRPDLPPSLRDYFTRITIPSFSVWTYWDLPVDLGPTPNKARQKLVKNMLGALGWPKGSAVFWPLSRLQQNTLVADVDLFTYGIRAITPVYIFCFGEQGCELLAPDKDPRTYPRTHSPHTSAMVQFLPCLNGMLPDNRETKKAAWSILKAYSPMPM